MTRSSTHGGAKKPAGPERPRVPVDSTSELSSIEEAVVKLLPKWPDAYYAVLNYARELCGLEAIYGIQVPAECIPKP